MEINLAREDAAYARSLLDRFGFRYSVVESGDRVRIVLVGRQAVAFAAGLAAVVDELEGEPLELVYLVGKQFGKHAVLKMSTPGEAREAVSHISVIAPAEVRGYVVKAGGDFLTRLLDVSLNFRQMKRGIAQVVKAFVSRIYDPRRKAVYVSLRLYKRYAELYIPRIAGACWLAGTSCRLTSWGRWRCAAWGRTWRSWGMPRRSCTPAASIGKSPWSRGWVDAATLLEYLEGEDEILQQEGKLYLFRWTTAEFLKRGVLRKSDAQGSP